MTDPADELRRLDPSIPTTALVGETMRCTIGDVRSDLNVVDSL